MPFNGKIARIIVVAGGAVLCGLLLFADKTNLTNESRPVIANNNKTGDAPQAASSSLSPLAADAETDALISKVAAAQGAAKITLLKALLDKLATRNRFDHAAKYAKDLVAAESNTANKLRAAELCLKANRLDVVQADTVLFRSFSEEAIAYVEPITKAEPKNEAALLLLGTAYVESANAAYPPMMGIGLLRQVLEINPQSAAAMYQLGLFSIKSGQFEKAVDRFEAIAKLKTTDFQEESLYGLALAKSNLNQNAEAKKILEKLIAITKNSSLKAQAAELKSRL